MSQVSDALFFLEGIENGNQPLQNIAKAAEPLDPFMIYMVIRYLRERYPSSSPQAMGVVERLVKITTDYPTLVKASQQGERDALKEWFDESFAMKDFFGDPEEMLNMVQEKIDS